MSVLNILALALLQGLTELLPISSSAHLILVPVLSGWPDQGLMVDASLHLGTFCAIALYFWRDCLAMLLGCLNLLTPERVRRATSIPRSAPASTVSLPHAISSCIRRSGLCCSRS